MQNNRVKATRKQRARCKPDGYRWKPDFGACEKQLEEDGRKTEQQENGPRIGTGYK
jgi:hypothetical protein